MRYLLDNSYLRDATVTLRLDQDQVNALKLIASFHDTSVSHFIRQGIDKTIQDHSSFFKGYESSLKKQYHDWLNDPRIQEQIALAVKFGGLYGKK